jgi:hypothetical protein
MYRCEACQHTAGLQLDVQGLGKKIERPQAPSFFYPKKMSVNGDELMMMNYGKPAFFEPAPVKSKPAIPLRTMFRWRNGNNRRSAIHTTKGMVQVKVVEDGIDRGQLSTFPDYDAWAKSLPPGEITAYEHDPRTVLQKRLDMPRPAYTDATLVHTLFDRFKITSRAWSMPSINNKLATLRSYAEYYSDMIQRTEQEGGETLLSRRSLKELQRRIAALEALSHDVGEERSHENPYKFKTRGRTQLYVQVKGALREIACHLGKIVDFHEQAYNSFAEMGADMVDGQPVLFVFNEGTFHKVK